MNSGPLFGTLLFRALGGGHEERRRSSDPPVPGPALGERRRPAFALAWLAAALVIGAAAIWLVAPAVAAAQWSSPPFDLSAPGEGSRPQVAVDPAGNATVVWEGDPGGEPIIRARRIDAGGALGPVQDVSAAGEDAVDPRVVVDPFGNATVVWTGVDSGDGTVHSRRITAAGTLDEIKDLSAPGGNAFGAEVAVDAAGTATVAWTREDDPGETIQARRVDSAGVLSPIEDLSASGINSTDKRVAADLAGEAFVVWDESVGGDNVIRGRRLRAAGLDAVLDLSAPGESAFAHRVAVDRAGTATAVWHRQDGTIQLRQADAGGVLGAITDLSAPGAEALNPRLALDPAGNVTVVWTRFDGTSDRAELRRMATGGTLGDIRELWNGGNDLRPLVGLDAGGTATVVWVHVDDSGTTSIRSRTASPDGQLGETLHVSPDEEETVVPDLATDPSGNSTVAWGRQAPLLIVGSRFATPGPSAVTPPTVPPPVQPVAPVSCPAVTLGKLRAHTAGQPRSRSSRAKGVGARLTLSRAARLQIVAATVRYRLRGSARVARLRATQLTTGREPKLRLRLPRKLARRLDLGTRVKVTLKLRARPAGAGCAFGKARSLSVRTKLIWVVRR
jgi:hypothetical protein